MSTSNELMDFAINHCPWWAQEGPQEDAFDCEADMLLYGGAAGGGKTALACGLAVVAHRETLFIRREATQLGAVVDEVATILQTRDGYNGAEKVWRLPAWDGVERKIVFGSTPHAGDETKYQGRPRDLLVVDEAANMLESQVHFLKGWVRTTVPGQRCRVLLCSNPPTSASGLWLIQWFAPWLDPTHANPAAPGELRWYAAIEGKDVPVDSGDPFYHGEELVRPQSRTFIPARVTDNKYLMDTGYLATLQALPEPLRSQMLYGDFSAGQDDSQWQVIPTAWVRQAQSRWKERPLVAGRVTSAGLDPSRGGRDQTVLAMREGWHYHRLQRWEGHQMDTGGKVAAKTVELVGSSMCPVHVDVIGIGASVIDHLDMLIHERAVPVNAAEKSQGQDWTGNITFTNRRAELWWRFRDLLNPANAQNIELPPDQQLLSELCAPTYTMTPSGIRIESKPDIIKRLGRSTDSADAVIMAAERTAVMNISGYSKPRINVHGSMGR